MRFNKLAEKKWYTGAVIACIAVAFFVLLTNLGTALSAVGAFLRNFRVVFLAFIFAYILNPFAEFFYYKLFPKMKLGKVRWALSIALAFLLAMLAGGLLLGILIPQLVRSITLFASSFEEYAASLMRMIHNSPLENIVDADQLETLADNALGSVSNLV